MQPNHVIPAYVLREAQVCPLGALRRLMAVNDGAFHLMQARALGVERRELRALLSRGEAVAVHQAVYRSAATAPGFRERLRAALLATGNGVVSHTSAAALLGIPGAPPGRPEVTVQRGAARQIDEVRIHVTRQLDHVDCTTAQGLRCTTAPRTILDLAGRLDAPRLLSLVDEAIWAGRCDRSILFARASELANGRPQAGAVTRATAPGADERFRSKLERNFGRLVVRWDLPRPAVNAPVRLRGRLFIVDNLWEPQRVVVELHGLRFHDTPDAIDRDAERQNLLTAAGYVVLVFTWRQIHQEAASVADQIRRAVAGRS